MKSSKIRIDDDTKKIKNDTKVSKESGGKIKQLKGRKVKNIVRGVKQSRSARIRETKADREIEQSDNFSVAMMFIIIIICFVLGIAIGYILYNIAISSGSAAFIVG